MIRGDRYGNVRSPRVTDEAKTPDEPEKGEQPLIGLAEFLESHPPGSRAEVRGVIVHRIGSVDQFLKPDVQLHCSSEKCGGIRIFRCERDSELSTIKKEWQYRFLTYICRNCGEGVRIYAVASHATAGSNAGVYKIGEYPPFGPPVPARVISLVGPERDLFLKGRRTESQGLGVGAFAYYRRVVESQWRRVVEEIIRVAERVGAPEPMLVVLREAAKETQFSKAVERIKDGIPEALKVGGHNPLTLLYSALSEGLHDRTDEECLELASSVRVVLTELAERIGQALKDERELQDAVTRLLNRKSGRGSGGILE